MNFSSKVCLRFAHFVWYYYLSYLVVVWSGFLDYKALVIIGHSYITSCHLFCKCYFKCCEKIERQRIILFLSTNVIFLLYILLHIKDDNTLSTREAFFSLTKNYSCRSYILFYTSVRSNNFLRFPNNTFFFQNTKIYCK